MKKFYSFLFAAVALVGFAACNSDSTEEPTPAQENVGKMEFTANVDEATKTTLDGVSVKWCDDDVIGVNDKSYTIKEGTNEGTTATLVGEPVEAPYVAVYPLSAFNSYNKLQEFINITLDANVAAGTFADGANIAMAVSKDEDTNLLFKNLLSVLKFQVAAECETVTINSENPLVGTVNFNYECFYAGASTYETSIELTIDGGFKTGTTYYTTIIPGIHKFTVLTDGNPSREAKAGTTLYRNQVVDLGTLPVASDWGLVGAFNGWDTENKATMYVEGDNFVARNFAGGEFKFVKGNTWDVSRGIRGSDVLAIGGWNMLGANSKNINLPAGNYDIYLNRSNGVFNIVNAGEEIEDYVLPEGKVIYLKAGVWTVSDAYFEAWVWGAGDQWCEFADIDDSGIFRAVVPNGTTGMKILRKDPTTASHGWDSWNDSGDQTIPADKNMFIVNNWDNYSWGTK